MSSASAPGAAIPPFSLDNTIGAILIGYSISLVLFGVTSLQTYVYFHQYPKDKPVLKFFVVLVWFIDAFDTALAVQICYHYLISNFNNAIAIFSPVWSLKLHVLVTSLSNFIVRSLYAQRIYILSHRNKVMTAIICALSIIDLVVGAVITAKAFKIPTFAGLTVVANLFYLDFASIIAADSCVALTLTYYLWKNKTGSKRTDSLVNKLVVYTVNTGLLTVIDASVGLISYAASPTTLIFIAFYLNLSKFYVNSYLATLNVRNTLMTTFRTDGTNTSGETSGIGISRNMPMFQTFASENTGYLSTNTPPELLTMDTLDTSNTSRGDGSTAVNTPIDGPASNLETLKRVVGSTSDLKKSYSLGSVHSDTVSESEAPTKDQAGDRRPKSGSDIV